QFESEHDDRVAPKHRNRKGRGPFRYCDQGSRPKQGAGGGGNRGRPQDTDGDINMMDEHPQEGGSQRRFTPYGRPNGRGNRRGGGGGGAGGGFRGLGGKDGGGRGGGGGGGGGGNRKNWFKITVPHGKKYDKEWLLTALRGLCSIPFHPVHVSSSSNSGPYSELIQLLFKRFDGSQQALDLNNIRIDPDLVSLNIEVALNRKNSMQAVIKIIEENIPELVCLNLSNNRLYRLDDLGEIVNKTPNLKILNLSQNEIKTERELDRLKGLSLTELWLSGNPLCNHFKDQTAYISAVRERFPKLQKLNLILCFLQQYVSTRLPPCSTDRQPLLDAYHDGAAFSLSIPFSMQHPSNLGEYQKDSRNIKRLKDSTTRFRLLKHTRLNVVAFLNELPKTQHDVASFNVDVNTFTNTLLSFTVSGVFKEVDGKSRDSFRAFSRVFISVPAGNSSLCIINDEMFIRNATTEEIRRAFVAPAPTPSSSPVPTLSATQQEMLNTFSSKSGMNIEWSQKCLQDNDWDFDRAAQIFTELKAQGKIPDVAFMK
uniref:Nuclear RNA export factor 1 n=1 Tax=Denticeps clupeoides TaxID=299321 RepID=A0AAY4EN71_9TELE